MDNYRVAIEPFIGLGKVVEWIVPVNSEEQRTELKNFISAAIQAYHDWLVDGE